MSQLEDMGTWNNQHNKHYKKECYYRNKDAIEATVRYITRSRKNETRANELISIGGSGIPVWKSVEDIISYLVEMQQFWDIERRKGRRLFHLVYSFNNKEFHLLNYDYKYIDLIAREICIYFFNLGFQTVYAVHHDIKKNVHIHIIINSINFINGYKYHQGAQILVEQKKMFDSYLFNNMILAENERRENNIVPAVTFYTN